MRIKKKTGVIPFRETLAYRAIMVIALMVAFLISLYLGFKAYRESGFSTITLGLFTLAAIAALTALYNVEQLKNTRIPAATMKKMKRR